MDSKPIDTKEITRLASIGCTKDEICQILGISLSLLGMKYQFEYSVGIAKLHETIRKAQIDCALNREFGNASMLMFLGKVYLKQREQEPEDRLSDLDLLLEHLEKQAKCSNYLANNFKATENPTQE